jgi:hypothetical protein
MAQQKQWKTASIKQSLKFNNDFSLSDSDQLNYLKANNNDYDNII